SPSTVTVALQKLESRLGAQLFRRTTRSLSLTPDGERFLETCRRTIAELDAAMEGLTGHGPLRGRIRITATNDFGRATLCPFIHTFLAQHPDVVVDLLLTDDILDLVDEGFDIGIRTGPLPDSALHFRLLVRGPRHICAAPAYWDEHGRPTHPRDLASHNCLILGRSGAPLHTWRFQSADETFSIRVDGDRLANDGEVLRTWAIAGAGVVLKSRWDVADDLAAGRLESCLDAFMADPVNLYAVHPAGRALPRRVEVMLTALADHVTGS
ncbi:MAG: LysR family transcriptional regulator, partial [Myxococcales bacterium]|nr:LysR family transcriptional regulator [Myxococcales bacterium]